MPCIDPRTERRAARLLPAAALLAGLAACTVPPAPAPAPPEPVAPAMPGTPPAPTPPVAVPAGPARNWVEYKQQAAMRLVQANGDAAHLGTVPEPLLGIPILDIELNADGSVRRIEVVRTPPRAPGTVERAIAAVRRAAPFPAVSHLPRPWVWRETFLYDEGGRFKPRTLD